MPRQSRSRPAARPAAPAPSRQQQRGAHTQTAPVPHQQQHNVPAQHAPVQGQKAPGMFSQMASTAAGVAVGSTVGHGLSGMLFGGGSAAAAPAEVPQAPVQQQSFDERRMGGACEMPAKEFTQCLNATGNDMSACAWYLENLKACQSAAAQYS